MFPQMPIRILTSAAAFATLILAGCMNQQPVSDEKTLDVVTKTTDPRIEFLVSEAGVPRELISVMYDSLKRDTGYIIEPRITAEQKSRGLRGTGVGLKSREIDRLIRLKAERESDAANEPRELETSTTKSGLLSKKSHTRWDHWYASYDVKKVTEVRNVLVFITQTGPARLGPNWIAGVRSAISNWNAQAKGTAVSFSETANPDNADLIFRGSFGIGADGTLTSSAFLTADEFMRPDGISLWVNTGYESSATPHNQKTTIGMSLLALSTNITFTGMEGYYWNDGASITIPGTPINEGDGLTPGSSILTYGTSSVSTPVMTANDLKAFRTLYPTWGTTTVLSNDMLYGPGKRGFTSIDMNVMTFQANTDTLIYLRRDGKLFRRIGNTGTNVQLWPGTGSSGNVASFLYSKGYYAVVTTTGKIYWKSPTSNWVFQNAVSVNPEDIRLDGNRLIFPYNGRMYIMSYTLNGNTPQPLLFEYYSATSTLQDWAIRNGQLLVVDDGNIWGSPSPNNWIKIHDQGDGYAYNVQMSDQLMAMYYHPVGAAYPSLAVRHGGMYGWWAYYSDPMYSYNDLDLCGDKVAFLQQSTYLRVIDYSTWTVYEHYSMPTGSAITRVKLSGPNCDYVTAVGSAAKQYPTLTKYGVDLDNQYSAYLITNSEVGQGTVPRLR